MSKYTDRPKYTVMADNLEPNNVGILLAVPATITIYSVFFPMLLVDLVMTIYQGIYFTVYKIPKIPRQEYLVIDRHKLDKLTGLQKFHCVYCGYANGVAAWTLAIAQQTELYNCAIKHETPVKLQENQEKYREREEFSS